jgi:hypothetical protein
MRINPSLATFSARSPIFSRSLQIRSAPMMSRRSTSHRLAPRDGDDRLLLDLALQRVDAVVGGDDRLRERDVALHDRLDGLPDLRLVETAHLADLEREGLQIGVECPSGMFDHGNPHHLRQECFASINRASQGMKFLRRRPLNPVDIIILSHESQLE